MSHENYFCEADWATQSPCGSEYRQSDSPGRDHDLLSTGNSLHYGHSLQVPRTPLWTGSEHPEETYYGRNSDCSCTTIPSSVDYNINDEYSGQPEMYEKRFSKLCNTDLCVVYRGSSRERINQLNKNRRGVLFKDLESSAAEDEDDSSRKSTRKLFRKSVDVANKDTVLSICLFWSC